MYVVALSTVCFMQSASIDSVLPFICIMMKINETETLYSCHFIQKMPLFSCILNYVLFPLFSDKPPIEDLQYFLDFQISRVWAPEQNNLQRKEPVCPSLQFSLMGPKLYISPDQVYYSRVALFCS